MPLAAQPACLGTPRRSVCADLHSSTARDPRLPLQLVAYYKSWINIHLLWFRGPLIPNAIRKPVVRGLLAGLQKTEKLRYSAVPVPLSPGIPCCFHPRVSSGHSCRTYMSSWPYTEHSPLHATLWGFLVLVVMKIEPRAFTLSYTPGPFYFFWDTILLNC